MRPPVSLATRMADLLVVAPDPAKLSERPSLGRAERGRAAMEKTAIDQPGVFFATCARLIGPEVKLTIEQTLPGNLSMEDCQVMRDIVEAAKQAIPDASRRVLQVPCFSTAFRTRTVVRMPLDCYFRLARVLKDTAGTTIVAVHDGIARGPPRSRSASTGSIAYPLNKSVHLEKTF